MASKATLIVRDWRTTHHATRKRLIRWLRDKADELEATDPKEYSEKYQSRFD